jgi:hypothetical protein
MTMTMTVVHFRLGNRTGEQLSRDSGAQPCFGDHRVDAEVMGL